MHSHRVTTWRRADGVGQRLAMGTSKLKLPPRKSFWSTSRRTLDYTRVQFKSGYSSCSDHSAEATGPDVNARPRFALNASRRMLFLTKFVCRLCG